jgi:hypothetical protein
LDNLATKVTRILPREDGSEIKIVAQAYFGVGLHRSVGVDVFRRRDSSQQWALCSDKPHPNWRAMPVAEYVQYGRSEMLQAATPGEILSVVGLIGKPLAEIASFGVQLAH